MTTIASLEDSDDWKKKNAFPFTTIIVTNPDEASAKSAQTLLESTLQKYFLRNNSPTNAKDIRIISTCDPFGARCGSFGGTLAALELIREENRESAPNTNSIVPETVLVLHAGGDSSRCPLSMILGKAWTNLPSENYTNPIAWLIAQLEDLFSDAEIPEGSLVVTATDCLLSFRGEENVAKQSQKSCDIDHSATIANGDSEIETTCRDPFTVLGVAIPAPLSTSKNHGVFIMPENSIQQQQQQNDDSSSFAIETPLEVWQKPSIEDLSSKPIPTNSGTQITASFDVPQRSAKQAWIDTGVVIFYPGAFETIKTLSKGLLSRCTRDGLAQAYTDEDSSDTLESFAKTNALKVDLYTDIMHNLPLGSTVGDATISIQESRALAAQKSTTGTVKDSLKQVLSVMQLQVLLAPQGSFLHLGTTQELIEFITTPLSFTDEASASAEGESKTDNDSSTMDHYLSQLPRALRLNRRFESIPAPRIETNGILSLNTTLQSIFPSDTAKTRLGSSTFVEYSNLQDYDSVTIGDHCMLSGWRTNDSPSETLEDSLSSIVDIDVNDKSLRIPDCMSVQLLPLVSTKKEEQWVMMVLGTTDSIKTPIQDSNIYGVPFPTFVYRTGILHEMLGFRDELTPNNNLWTAKIHPILKSNDVDFESFFGWIEMLRRMDPALRDDKSFQNWCSAERVSLQDIHGISDASKEWDFRVGLERKIWSLQCQHHIDKTVMLIRSQNQNVPCDLQWLTEMKNGPSGESSAFVALSALVDALEQLALEEFATSHYNISGRALMLASASVANFPRELIVDSNTTENSKEDSNDDFMPTDRMSIVKTIFDVRHSKWWNATEESMVICSEMLERLALNMIESTIRAGFQRHLESTKDSTNISMKRTSEPIFDNYVISTAPVRVDLAGGWSDTPPITYEYGGSVTGMAVLMDDCFPLSCRCRVVSGRKGILLKTELRELPTGALVSSRKEEITDLSHLQDFRDTSANCALLKAALMCLGLVSEEDLRLSRVSLQVRINQFCSSAPEENVRIEIITTSLLGMGTGMGTSSILGACILQSLATCVGIGKLSDERLIYAVLVLEQLLSSGGGWQDQAHGIVPGIKTITCAPKTPLEIQIEPIPLSSDDLSALEDRLMFAYTGKTRLAKNILQQVLRRWARRTPEIVETVQNLVDCSRRVRTALEDKSWDELGQHMYNGYRLKCAMAGEHSGAEPESVKIFVSQLMARDQIHGAMLCGAGGGGFLLLLLSESASRASVESVFAQHILPLHDEFSDFLFHDCKIAQRGLTTTVLEENGEAAAMDENTYSLSWQQYSQQHE